MSYPHPDPSNLVDTLMRPEILAILGLGAGIAGFVDTLAGGGGLITVPLLLLSGLPPVATLATNKLQGCFGTLAATVTLVRRGRISLHDIKADFAMATCGGFLGAAAVRLLKPGALDLLIPIVLGAIGLYFAFAPSAGEIESKARLTEPLYFAAIAPAIGFYDGFFGPGAGSFYAATGVAWRGKTLLHATATAKVLNFGSNFGALLLFIQSGKTVWLVGALMICGQVVGAYLGSLAMISGGARLIRPLIVVTCFIMIARYAWQKGLLSGSF